ncbi:hypothetical protein [Spirosoma oryzicola]|uniref:hypothetical protein n=1 Tax=Spirosoma oryzicola TaxID=2898794 RepID=UPI001E3E6C46|nr:hypothetical protein [Spirosoma oryzicola]UHG94103.1 hypothetical protein LQ777_25525 [Spirosoma oryzicola]
MTLHVTSSPGDKPSNDFSCQLDSIEDAFDALNTLVVVGQTLHGAYLVDQDHIFTIPVAAFDGQPIGDTIARLEKEWQYLLDKPSPDKANNANPFWQERVDSLTTRIQNAQRMIANVEGLLARATEWKAGALKTHTVNRYTRYIIREKAYLMKLSRLQKMAQGKQGEP